MIVLNRSSQQRFYFFHLYPGRIQPFTIHKLLLCRIQLPTYAFSLSHVDILASATWTFSGGLWKIPAPGNVTPLRNSASGSF